MSKTLCYVAGAELPPAGLTLRDFEKKIIDFSTGWTFELRIRRSQAPVYVKTTGIVGADTAPNVTIAWDLNELSGFNDELYSCQLWARNPSDRDRVFSFKLKVDEAIMAP